MFPLRQAGKGIILFRKDRERRETTDTKKGIDRLFAVSLVLMGISSLILSVTGLTGTALPDWAVRTLGIINLIALPVLIYPTVRNVQEKNRMRQSPEAKAERGGAKKKKGRKK